MLIQPPNIEGIKCRSDIVMQITKANEIKIEMKVFEVVVSGDKMD
jgi:hypothetical protein